MLSKKSIKAVKKFVDRAVDAADGRYYTSIARAIEELMHCRIRLCPVDEHHLRGRAETLHRTLKVKIGVPTKRTLIRAEHWIFYDSKLPPAAAAKCVAHELFHIFEHRPTAKSRQAPNHRICYELFEERDADIFALLLLGTRQFSKENEIPKNRRKFLGMIRDSAGLPGYLAWEEVQKLADYLFPSESKPARPGEKRLRRPPL